MASITVVKPVPTVILMEKPVVIMVVTAGRTI
jgi:hypothetical protein